MNIKKVLLPFAILGLIGAAAGLHAQPNILDFRTIVLRVNIPGVNAEEFIDLGHKEMIKSGFYNQDQVNTFDQNAQENLLHNWNTDFSCSNANVYCCNTPTSPPNSPCKINPFGIDVTNGLVRFLYDSPAQVNLIAVWVPHAINTDQSQYQIVYDSRHRGRVAQNWTMVDFGIFVQWLAPADIPNDPSMPNAGQHIFPFDVYTNSDHNLLRQNKKGREVIHAVSETTLSRAYVNGYFDSLFAVYLQAYAMSYYPPLKGEFLTRTSVVHENGVPRFEEAPVYRFSFPADNEQVSN